MRDLESGAGRGTRVMALEVRGLVWDGGDIENWRTGKSWARVPPGSRPMHEKKVFPIFDVYMKRNLPSVKLRMTSLPPSCQKMPSPGLLSATPMKMPDGA
ncbi:hypothetical protein LZ554_004644 [Drepanopeziza brunnea f. sp. 'monogermtubi']|nr:hypothetical protein LZ554_004644 [Drepanopeziza brunnea f. sp. 'monogermtubi']